MTVVQIGRRRTIYIPRLQDEPEEIFESDGVRIKAEVSSDEIRCTFTVNKTLFEGYGWWFANQEAAAGSPLAETLLADESVDAVLIEGDEVTVSRSYMCMDEWDATAKIIGNIIRTHIVGGDPAVSPAIAENIPDETTVRTAVQRIIEDVLNPGVAGHGGLISLIDVKGNGVWVNMGGGCQGCSAAAVTLRQSVEGELRKAVPFLGGIHDATDHSAGTNPYMR